MTTTGNPRSALALLACVLLLPVGDVAAFCGFFVSGADAKLYNNASQVVLMRKGNRTVMTRSNNYKGPPEDFAMVVPVPVVLKKEDVKTLQPDVFAHIDALSAPRLVEYWEQDPCARDEEEKEYLRRPSPKKMSRPAESGAAADDLGVTVEARFTVGEYEIVILSAREAGGLDTWLRRNRYKIPEGAAGALAPYIRSQMKFFVAKVNIQKVRRDANNLVVLSPLRFAFESQELRLPVRLGLLNAESPAIAGAQQARNGAKQDLLVYVLHPQSRFEVANYKNVFIPSNLEVLDEVRQGFGAFYAQLFDETLAKHDGKAVVTEYAWQTSSCDPCPVPPLQPSDLYTLGSDILEGPQRHLQEGGAGAPAMKRGRGGFFGGFSPWVLTRLHTRYDKQTLSEDLLFREARPVVGGRSTWDGTGMELPGEVKPDSANNFQGRYIIRHYWQGKVACANPRWNTWGGPAGSGQRSVSKSAEAARDLANAPRGQVKLSKVVRSALPGLGLAGLPVPKRAAK